MKLTGGFRKKPTQPIPRRRLSAERQLRNDTLDGAAQPRSPSNQSSPPTRSFRRNQTLTGSRSNDIPTATEYSRHSSMQSPRAHVHHLKHRRRKLGRLLLAGLAASIVLTLLLMQFTATVRVSLYGQIAPLDNDDQARLDAAVDGYLQRYPVERIRGFLDQDRLVAYLVSQDVREVRRVAAVRGDGIGQTAVELVAREPIASWTIGADRRFVDESGVVFSHNYFDTPTVQIRDESGIGGSEDQATAVTSARFLRFIGQAVAGLTAYDLDVATVSIPATTTRQVDLIIGKSRIKMTIDRPAGEQSQDAARAWQYLDRAGRTVRYVDVRVSGKAFYR